MDRPYLSAHINYTEKPDLEHFRMHTHENYEIYVFLSGDAKYFVEGTVYPLKPGDLLVMKKAEAHSLLINTCQPYERMIINFTADALLGENKERLCAFLDGRPLGQNNQYPAAAFKDTQWRHYLNKICTAERIEERQLYLTVLVTELYENYSDLRQAPSAKKDNMIEMINYINVHLTENLTLEELCKEFYISKAQINRKFKQITGTTVWAYIVTKRLLLAKELLQQGGHPTKVFVQCGFNDYCSFFRAYKAKFGVSPKDDYEKGRIR